MAVFNDSVEYVLEREGGFQENITDAGGTTHFGISLRFLRGLSSEKLKKYGIFEPITADTIRNIVAEQAKFIYQGEFWNDNHFEDICDQRLCNYIFDMCINMGITPAIKLVQRASWAVTFLRGYLRDDGILGGRTLYFLNLNLPETLPAIIAMRASFYRLIVEKNPQQKGNLNGWINRCYFLGERTP